METTMRRYFELAACLMVAYMSRIIPPALHDQVHSAIQHSILTRRNEWRYISTDLWSSQRRWRPVGGSNHQHMMLLADFKSDEPKWHESAPGNAGSSSGTSQPGTYKLWMTTSGLPTKCESVGRCVSVRFTQESNFVLDLKYHGRYLTKSFRRLLWANHILAFVWTQIVLENKGCYLSKSVRCSETAQLWNKWGKIGRLRENTGD